MSFRKVDAGRGIVWITEAAQLIGSNPVPFLLMGLLLAVVVAVPLIGALALTVLGPALYGGIMLAAREQAAGRRADFPQLFTAFQQAELLPKMLLLCLPGIAAGVVVLVLLVIFAGSAIVAVGVSAAANSEALAGASLGGGMLIFLLLATAVGVAAYSLVFFAIPRVMLQGAEPIAAMQDSARAFLANLGAVLICLFTLTIGCMLLGAVLSAVSTFIAQLLITSAAIPLVSVTLWRACQDVYGGAEAGPMSAPPPPPPSLEV